MKESSMLGKRSYKRDNPVKSQADCFRKNPNWRNIFKLMDRCIKQIVEASKRFKNYVP